VDGEDEHNSLSDNDVAFEFENEEELEQEYQRLLYLESRRQRVQRSQQERGRQPKVAFEVDYDYFLAYFWPQVRHRLTFPQITANIVWTEIFSCIKGSTQAHLFPGQYVTKHAYLTLDAHKNFLAREHKDAVFELFVQYERWKLREGGYDLMDVVNYLLRRFVQEKYHGPFVHYLMIDEV